MSLRTAAHFPHMPDSREWHQLRSSRLSRGALPTKYTRVVSHGGTTTNGGKRSGNGGRNSGSGSRRSGAHYQRSSARTDEVYRREHGLRQDFALGNGVFRQAPGPLRGGARRGSARTVRTLPQGGQERRLGRVTN